MSDAPPPLAESQVAAAATHPGAFVCPNCAHENTGEFCASCGQKRLHADDLALRHAWHHVVHELLHLDGKVFNSLRLLFTRPGQLTLDFLEGRRARHVHPVRLFLVFGLVFFFFARVNSPVDLRTALNNSFDPAARARWEELAGPLGLTSDQLSERINARTIELFKPVDIAAILLHGVWLWLLCRRRRPRLGKTW